MLNESYFIHIMLIERKEIIENREISYSLPEDRTLRWESHGTCRTQTSSYNTTYGWILYYTLLTV